MSKKYIWKNGVALFVCLAMMITFFLPQLVLSPHIVEADEVIALKSITYSGDAPTIGTNLDSGAVEVLDENDTVVNPANYDVQFVVDETPMPIGDYTPGSDDYMKDVTVQAVAKGSEYSGTVSVSIGTAMFPLPPPPGKVKENYTFEFQYRGAKIGEDVNLQFDKDNTTYGNTDTVLLGTIPVPAGYVYKTGNTFSFYRVAADTRAQIAAPGLNIVQIVPVNTLVGSGTLTDPYIISTQLNWDTLCDIMRTYNGSQRYYEITGSVDTTFLFEAWRYNSSITFKNGDNVLQTLHWCYVQWIVKGLNPMQYWPELNIAVPEGYTVNGTNTFKWQVDPDTPYQTGAQFIGNDVVVQVDTATATPIPPTEEPTAAPTDEPTEAPILSPSPEPSEQPTEAPTEIPTSIPLYTAVYVGADTIGVSDTLLMSNIQVTDIDGHLVDADNYDVEFIVDGVSNGIGNYTILAEDLGKVIEYKVTPKNGYDGVLQEQVGTVADVQEQSVSPSPNPTSKPTLAPTSVPTVIPTDVPTPTPTPESYILHTIMVQGNPHVAYMQGYPGNTFGADRGMTRAEVVVMLSRFLIDQNVLNAGYYGMFSDVHADSWFAPAIEFFAKQGILQGRDDGIFDPNAQITRAEFAAIVSRLDNIDTNAINLYNDVSSDYWATMYINSATDKGWFTGYDDGSFRPEANITRAEVVALINRVFNRHFDVTINPNRLIKFTDVGSTYWAYDDIMEATNAHEFASNVNGVEIWK